MGKRDAWLKVFPIPRASNAVDALIEGWQEMASHPKTYFNHETHEPDLTLVLTEYLRNVIHHKKRLLGNWTSEDVRGKVDFATGKIIKRTRTDICFNWNDEKQNYSVVFEFKKLDRKDSSRKHYYGENGMQRFVTGEYSVKHPLAFMVGILTDGWDECVDPLRACLQQNEVSELLKMCRIEGAQLLQSPSELFPTKATFDTKHRREYEKAPPHGTIRISHIFLPFGYASPMPKGRSKSVSTIRG